MDRQHKIMMQKSAVHIVILVLASLCLFGRAWGQIRHEVFLPNTEHELHIYRIFGDEPGKTIMIIGGIQGDEPGGYLTADLYADIHLEKGNLIVVPRANFYSILLNRREGLTGDMNRKFDPDNSRKRNNLEEEVVEVLKHLIGESDCLLNLHEGSGFYSPLWIDNMENPRRYGQSIIYDTREYQKPGTSEVIELEKLAMNVIDKVNDRIENKRYHFRANNHDTLSEQSIHKEQRKSATFYALTQAHIPAFGVETSKTIHSLETKIRLYKLVINTIMEEFGIIVDSPGVRLAKPKLDYLLVKVNSGHTIALPNGAMLELDPGDEIVVMDILANYKRGLVADIEGFGTKNDNNRPFRFSEETRIVVRKDAQKCGWIDLAMKSGQAAAQKSADHPAPPGEDQLRAEELLVDINGEMNVVNNQQTLPIKRGDRLIMQGVRSNIAYLDNNISVNFKGFAPPKAVNDGNDLLFPIYTDQDLWQRYSADKEGKLYPIIATYKDKIIGEFWVEVH